jgi:hypothetical protein
MPYTPLSESANCQLLPSVTEQKTQKKEQKMTNNDQILEVDLVEMGSLAVKQDEQPGIVVPTEEEVATVNRKLDLRLLPIVFLIYMLSVLDRSNLGNAHVATLDQDIGLTGNQYSFLGTVFYIGYILFQWTATGWKQV